MSFKENAKKDLRNVKNYWGSLPKNVQLLDLFSVVQILLFVAAYLIISISKTIGPIPTNSAMMIFPLAVAGFTFVLRMRIAKDSETIVAASKEFFWFFVLMVALVLVTVIYGIVLSFYVY